MNLKKRNKISAEFNMASLADVIFLLLIFFMLTSTLVAPNAIKLLLPKAEGQTLSTQSVEVTIDADLNYYIDNRLVPLQSLGTQLQAVTRNIKDPTVVLSVDK